jgi:hypothetical protein
MNVIVCYVGAVGLYGMGALCLRHTSPYSRAGGDHYLRRDRRRLIAMVMLVAATLCLATGLMIQAVESSR